MAGSKACSAWREGLHSSIFTSAAGERHHCGGYFPAVNVEGPMPDTTIVEVPVTLGEGVGSMAAAEENVMQAVLSGMATDAAAGASRRISRFDQLAADSAAMWGISMTTPTILAGMGFRVAQQSGGYPADTGTGTGGK
mgnify:CR=1 FL=1